MKYKRFDALSDPLVTIYLPTFNRVELLKRAVNSILSQTYRNFELIVVDDNSEDSTREYLEWLSFNEKNVRFFVNELNSGACFSRNRAIREARGELITGLDDDDYVSPTHIQSLVESWVAKDDETIAIYPNSIRVEKNKFRRASPRIKACYAKELLFNNWIGNQVLTEKSTLKEIGGFDEEFPAWQDYDCWYRLLSLTGKKAVCTNQYTYFLDASHLSARISSSSKDRIVKAWSLFCEKNNIASEEGEVLKLILLHYGIRNVKIGFIFKKILGLPSYQNCRHSLILVFKYFKIF